MTIREIHPRPYVPATTRRIAIDHFLYVLSCLLADDHAEADLMNTLMDLKVPEDSGPLPILTGMVLATAVVEIHESRWKWKVTDYAPDFIAYMTTPDFIATVRELTADPAVFTYLKNLVAS
jgi:hypothetical protein